MEEIFGGLGFAPFGVITAICFIVGLVINYSTTSERVKKSIPEIMILVGAGLGIAMFFTSVEFRNTAGEFWWALAIGGISGVAATGIHQVWKQKQKTEGADIITDVTSDPQTIDNSEIVPEPNIIEPETTIDPTIPTESETTVTLDEINPSTPTPTQKYRNPSEQADAEV